MHKELFSGKKIIVTGGAGFIGSALVKALVRYGADVSVIDNLWRGSLENLRLNKNEYAIDTQKKFHLADLTDYGKCLELIRDADYVYHLADVVAGVNFVFTNEVFVYRQNLLINTNTISACIVNNIQNYIYVGTACSYPKHLQMQDGIVRLLEDQTYPAEPESSYGWSKLMGEYEAEIIGKNTAMNIGLLRLHNVYGPGSVFDPERSQVLPALVRKAINYPNEKFIVWGSGQQYRDFVFVDDIVEALLLVAEKGMGKGLIQIGSEQATSIQQAAELIVKISGKQIPINYDISGPEGDRGRIADCGRAKTILGWQLKTQLEDGLINLYQWIAKQMAIQY
ncbi:MAG: NAD-dependent epimerase/dehydratase family protein [Deltaproteobacteria bacterium]